jgi:S-adenosylmethionine:tRNA ribosyltransferase-isomerase
MTDRSARVPDGSRVSDYDYRLPPGLVAQYPTVERDASRLLVLGAQGTVGHGTFPDIVELFEPGDVLVVNESKVLPARLSGRKPTGAQAEVFLVRPALDGADPLVWEALVRPGGKLKPGRTVVIGSDLSVEILDSTPAGNRIVRLVTDASLDEVLERHGQVPLPPYIDRAQEPADRERYQTVYARARGSVAAPTAGLHFTEELLDRIERRGVRRAAVTLHVGVGTFRPVDHEDPAEHEMHAERYDVSERAARTINEARAAGGRVWAVGTTAVRTLETVADRSGQVRAEAGETCVFLRPPYNFKVIDGLVTNFHLPRSTLLMLVCALAGYDRTMAAYREAVAAEYRFYSYGDAMVVPPTPRHCD